MHHKIGFWFKKFTAYEIFQHFSSYSNVNSQSLIAQLGEKFTFRHTFSLGPFVEIKYFRLSFICISSVLNWKNNRMTAWCSQTNGHLFSSIVKLARRSKTQHFQVLCNIGLITVFGTILKGRQNGQKLQCLYGNPIAYNFFQN